MTQSEQFSASGVRIADDFRSNLIIDRYDGVFADMRATKKKHLRSANSEDAVTWNVFRSLRQVAPDTWLPVIWARAFPLAPTPSAVGVITRLWVPVAPPPGLLDYGDEGISEIDIVIEAPTWVWFIEAKYKSDISTGTKTRPTRDQILRNLDVGSFYAGVREFYFSLLSLSEERSPLGAAKIDEYRDVERMRSLLAPHRPDGVKNLKALGTLTWADLHAVLVSASTAAAREDERSYALRAAAWLEGKGL